MMQRSQLISDMISESQNQKSNTYFSTVLVKEMTEILRENTNVFLQDGYDKESLSCEELAKWLENFNTKSLVKKEWYRILIIS